MKTIETLIDNKRMSTQELLQEISSAVAGGETEFTINASGQQSIGGPLWNAAGHELVLRINNPGQRVGAMCMDNTTIVVEGSAPADVGWLNVGGKITVKGDSGDTTAHCAASGKIYVGGRSGTRTGSLMKHDPLYADPELWVLKNCGSFSFEFMSGGVAVVCGWESDDQSSVLGDRACIGMVGGILYVRGPINGVSAKDVKVMPLEESDIAFLQNNLIVFLREIEREELLPMLSDWSEWQKAVPLNYDERPKKEDVNIKLFRAERWIEGGIFGDIFADDFAVNDIIECGAGRNKVPLWQSAACRDCRRCINVCPQKAIERTVSAESNEKKYTAVDEKCIGCGICAAVCDFAAWVMKKKQG